MKSNNKPELYLDNCIMLRSGCYFSIKDLNVEDVNIGDIALGLSRTYRFCGQSVLKITVAQHSCWVMDHLRRIVDQPSKELLITALMHDCTEAFMGDFPGPWKSVIPQYGELEEKMYEAFAKKYGMIYPIPEEVHQADKASLKQEWREFVVCDKVPEEMPYKPPRAHMRFLEEFNKVMNM